ncbi:MAG: GntR family transcriptional regulator, partial [Deltaproteobacteria bacterium]|nr:GntR family transcriptional regulator [Deltaproteobacteria bacterium]
MEPRRTIIDQIYHQLLERIQLGEIASGERLIETQVAGSLDTSRTPVREAFRRLEQDGIVERLPQGGVRVAPVTMEMVSEI